MGTRSRDTTSDETYVRGGPRPEPDEAPLRDDEAPKPQPERHEPTIDDPGLSDLSRRDWVAIVKRAGKEMLDDNIPMIASALAYSTFLAIPSVLLVATGLFTLIAGPDTINPLMQHLGQIAPKQTVDLLNGSLQRLNDHPGTGIVMTAVG